MPEAAVPGYAAAMVIWWGARGAGRDVAGGVLPAFWVEVAGDDGEAPCPVPSEALDS